MRVGIVYGEASTKGFEFIVDPKNYGLIKVGDIVKVKTGDKFSYAIVVEIKSKIPYQLPVPDFESMEFFMKRLGIKDRVLTAYAEFLWGKEESVEVPPLPGEDVMYPEEDEIRKLYEMSGPTVKIGSLMGKFSSIKPDINVYQILTKHLAIFGMTGSGKSYTTAVLLNEISEKDIPIIIFDVHRDYIPAFNGERVLVLTFDEDEVESIKNQYKNQRGEGDLEIKVMKIKITDVDFDILTETLGITPNMTRLYYTFKKIVEKVQPRSIQQIVNVLEDLEARKIVIKEINRIFPGDKEAEKLSTFSRLLSRVERLREWKIFPKTSEGLGEVDIEDIFVEKEEIPIEYEGKVIEGRKKRGIIIVDLFPLSLEEQKIVIDIFLRKVFHLWKERYKKRREINPVIIVVEEAHRFASKNTKIARMLSTIAREGRKFGIGLWIISQIPSKIDDTIVSQINTFVFMRITNPRDLDYIERSNPYLTEGYLKSITSLGQGEALIVGLGVKRPVILKVSSEKRIVIGGSEKPIVEKLNKIFGLNS